MTITHDEHVLSGPEDGAVDHFDVIAIGAGLTGLHALHRVLELGLTVRLFEYGGGVGGTWYWNRYPGCCFDSESETYAYAFCDEMVRDWNWKDTFSKQPENERYYNLFADKHDLRRHIRFESKVVATTWNEDEETWTVEIEDGYTATSRFLIGALGILSGPAAYVPDFPGRDTFAGESYHTARWPQDPVSFTGKRVGVIGTGSSGVQVIEQIAKDVGHLTVFQRTATYIGPLHNEPVSPEMNQEWREQHKEIIAMCESTPAGFRYGPDMRTTMSVSKEERWAFWEQLWTRPGFEKWLANFWDVTLDPEGNKDFADFIRSKIRQRVHDPAVADLLCPKEDLPFGSRRIPLETTYYDVFNQDNVSLVDVSEAAITEITPKGVKTADGTEYELDMIVYATGFDSFTGGFDLIEIRGENGRLLRDKWREEGPGTFMGLMVAGFPNFFTLVPRAFCNFPRCSDVIVNWTTDLINHASAIGATRIGPTQEAQDAWVVHQNSFAEGKLFASQDSWFNGGNIPGKQKVFLLYANTLGAYKGELEECRDKGYEGLVIE